ncbi:sporulation integral membrane protein YtvI [Bacillus carboniphilus]|uniref:Sporulation integral membrane protein YtvI n=1 Tax=Bacillus carboniphilus TaxID=86663 RepID=A0ABY9JXP4_9BACI|nr:sporulation integral membrane protein YtvI [Bacillus carboniphilus]WLR44166.1 sporulation integral membrane protein YtvI [Bacillus carboniphilus]
MNKQYLYITLRTLLVGLILIGGGYLVLFSAKLTYPFIIAWVLAIFMNPLVNLLENKTKMNRGWSVFSSIIIVFTIIAGLLTLLVAEIVNGTAYLSRVVPKNIEQLSIYLENYFVETILPLYNEVTSIFNNLNNGQQETILSNIKGIGTELTTTVGNFVTTFLNNIPTIFSWLPNTATAIVFSFLATFFISKDWYKLKKMMVNIIPRKAISSGKSVFDELKKALAGFIKAQLTLISMTAVIVMIGLLVLQVPYAITIALLIGFVDLLPYLGTGLVFVPWIIFLIFSGNIPLAIGMSILYVIVMLQRQFMEPKVLSSNIGLDPLATLIALFVGFKLVGFLGLIVGPVTLVIINTLYKTRVFHEIYEFIVGKPKVD